MEIVVIFTTIGSEEEATALISALLEERIIACGSIMPRVKSLYWWEGEIAVGEEVSIMLKTRREYVGVVEARFKEIHPYTTPEFVVVNPEHVGKDYATWLLQVTAPLPGYQG